VAVGLEVDADIEALGRVVEMLDARVGAEDGQLKVLLDVLSRGAIGVGGLDDTNLELLREAGGAAEVREEGGGERGDAVAVEEAEGVVFVGKVVDYAVGVAIEGGAAVAGRYLGGGWGALLGFDEVGAAL